MASSWVARNVGSWMSAFAYGTSYFSAVVFVGYAGQFGFKYGISATWAGIGNAIIGSLARLVGLRPPYPRDDPSSAGIHHAGVLRQALPIRRALRIAAAAIIFVFLIPYTASVYNGLSRLFGMAFALPYDVCVIGMAVVTCVYVVLGGLHGYGYERLHSGHRYAARHYRCHRGGASLNNGGFSEAIIVAVADPRRGFGHAGPLRQLLRARTCSTCSALSSSRQLGTWGLPQMVQKFYAIKTGPAIKQGAIISTIFAFVVAGGSYFLGGLRSPLRRARSSTPPTGTPIYDSIIPTMLSTLPDVLIGLVIVLVLSRLHVDALVAGAHVIFYADASTLSTDNIIKNMSEKKQLIWMRGLLVGFIAISAAHRACSSITSSVVFIAQLMGYLLGRAGRFVPRAAFLWGLYSAAHFEARACGAQLRRGCGT